MNLLKLKLQIESISYNKYSVKVSDTLRRFAPVYVPKADDHTLNQIFSGVSWHKYF